MNTGLQATILSIVALPMVLTTLFLATPIRFSGRVLQYLGRVLRPATDKKSARVYDYVDVKVGVLRSAAKHRQKVYATM